MSSKKIDQRFDIYRIVVSILIAIGLAFIAILAVSSEPLKALELFVTGPLTSLRRFGTVIELMIPLMFTGCAVCIMQQGGQSSMIMEGAFFFAGTIGAAFCLEESGFSFAASLPPYVGSAIVMIACAIFGGFMAFIPALLKYKWNANEVVASIMLNYASLYIAKYFLNYVYKDPSQGYLASYSIVETAKLSVIIDGTGVHSGLFLAIIVVVGSYFFLYRSKWGYAIRMTGQNANFAKYSGIAVGSVILYSQIIGGAISGFGGAVQLLGMYDRLNWSALPGYGFDGIVIAMIANRNPLAVPAAAFFLAYIRKGADIMASTTDVPTEMVTALQGVIILLVGAKMFLEGWRHKTIVKNAQKESLKEVAE